MCSKGHKKEQLSDFVVFTPIFESSLYYLKCDSDKKKISKCKAECPVL
jgi:hypothetical protein